MPLLETVINRLIAAGVSEVIVNLHHFPDQIRDFVREKNNFGIRIEFSFEETLLLDTGGGLKKAARFFDDGQPFIIHNVDILSNINLEKMFEHHLENKCLATLAVNERETKRFLIFDEENLLCGWKSLHVNKEVVSRAPKGKSHDLGFCGIHVVSADIFEKITEDGVFSIITSYMRLISAGERIMAFRTHENSWRDVGKLAKLEK